MTKPARQLTDTERKALWAASSKAGAQPTTSKTERGHVNQQVAQRLIDRGWLALADGKLRITRDGVRERDRPVEYTPVFLKQRDGLTTRAELSVRGEDEIIDKDTLNPFWAEEAKRREAAAKDRRETARNLRQQLRRRSKARKPAEPMRTYTYETCPECGGDHTRANCEIWRRRAA